MRFVIKSCTFLTGTSLCGCKKKNENHVIVEETERILRHLLCEVIKIVLKLLLLLLFSLKGRET